MALGIRTLRDTLESHLLTLGVFRDVLAHEPKSAPQSGTAAVWLQSVQPDPSSGLAATTAVVTFLVRIYEPMLAEPADDIDLDVGAAVDLILNAITGDFSLGGNARSVDLLGYTGQTLSAEAGYVSVDQTMYRVMDITVPVVVNDAWTQTA